LRGSRFPSSPVGTGDNLVTYATGAISADMLPPPSILLAWELRESFLRLKDLVVVLCLDTPKYWKAQYFHVKYTCDRFS